MSEKGLVQTLGKELPCLVWSSVCLSSLASLSLLVSFVSDLQLSHPSSLALVSPLVLVFQLSLVSLLLLTLLIGCSFVKPTGLVVSLRLCLPFQQYLLLVFFLVAWLWCS